MKKPTYNKISFSRLFLIFSIFIFGSCYFIKNGIKVEIANLSDRSITNVKFYAGDKEALIKFDKVEPKMSKINYLDMHGIENSEGSYVLEFKRENGVMEKINGGYYTNGSSVNQKVILYIKNDTILWRFK